VKRKSSFNLSVGASSILMIFVVLCLTTFAVLSYVTANADGKISTKNAETVENYYAATTEVEKKLQPIDDILLSAKQDAQQAAESGSCTGLSNYAQYQNRSRLKPVNIILQSAASMEEKRSVCYRYFSEMLLTHLRGVAVTTSDDGRLLVAFTVDAGGGRQIETKLAVAPYGDGERYKITSRKLMSAQPTESGLDDTLQLWTGSSAQ
jgi:hypothetical protein